MKIYVTFGQKHAHRINGTTFDKDSVAEIECDSHEDGREIAFELFNNEFFTTHETKDHLNLEFFPRGIFKAN